MSELADFLERFRRGPELIAVATTGAANPELDFVPAPGRWTIRQVACHVSDIEMANAIRFRRMLAEDRPHLEGYDGRAWAAHLDYARRKISVAVENFRRVRAETYDLIKDQPESVFARKGTHAEWGEIALLDLLRICAEHAEGHARQIMAARQRYKESKAK